MSLPTPPPSPAHLRFAVRRWRRAHRSWVLAGLLVSVAAWATAVTVLVGDDGGAVDGGVRLADLLTVAAVGASVTIALMLLGGHVATARFRWPRHFLRLPGLVRDVWRASRSRRAVAVGALAGLVVGLFVHPAVGIGTAPMLVGLTVTDVGFAVVAGWQSMAQAWRSTSAGRRLVALEDRRLGVVSAGLVLGVTALVRIFTLDAPCLASHLVGSACGASPFVVAPAAVIGAVTLVPLFLTLGALVSLTMDGQQLGDLAGRRDATARGDEPIAAQLEPPEPEPVHREVGRPEPEPVEDQAARPLSPPPDESELALAAAAALAQVAEEEHRQEPEEAGAGAEDAAEDEAGDQAGDPQPDDDPTIETAPLPSPDHARYLERLSPDVRDDLAPLFETLAASAAVEARSLITRIVYREGSIAALREQYERAPGIARGAIERACVADLRGAGVPGDAARELAPTMLGLPDRHWDDLAASLTALEATLPDG